MSATRESGKTRKGGGYSTKSLNLPKKKKGVRVLKEWAAGVRQRRKREDTRNKRQESGQTKRFYKIL